MVSQAMVHFRFELAFLFLITLTSCNQLSSTPSNCVLSSSATLNPQLQVGKIDKHPNSPVSIENYHWKNVAISGMGFVPGVLIHPQKPGLIYVRTDVGGIYRWDENTSSWIQLLDAEPDHYNVESFALDPSNPDVIYIATGAYVRDANGEILKSIDQGKTWTETNLRKPTGEPVGIGGHEEWRWAGERLAVDPNNGQIIYFGSRVDGLYRSVDGAKSWQPVTSFPTKGTLGGIVFVVFEPNSVNGNSALKRSHRLYVGVMGRGIYSSQDAGKTWSLLGGGPTSDQNPQQAVVAPDGTLSVTFFTTPANPQGSVWSYQVGQWKQVTPVSEKNYSAITVDPYNSKVMMVATYPLSPEGLYRTTDGGKSWKQIESRVQSVQWWPKWHLYNFTGGLAINPHQPKQVWLTTGFGVMRTDDITAHPVNWCADMNNLEELVVLVVKSPPVSEGASLFSGVADMVGFRHESLTTPPSQTYEKGQFGNTTGIDFAEANPNIIVRVGSLSIAGRIINGGHGYSSDNGRTWVPFSNIPVGAINGKVAVSATLQPNGKPIIVWAPEGDVYPHRSLDGGKTWLPVEGAPKQTTLQMWFPSQAIASDRIDGNLFYLYKYNESELNGRFYRSIDGGATWKPTVSGLPNHWLNAVKAVPAMRGNVWLRVQGSSIYRSSDAGTSFTVLANVDKAYEFTFGQPAPNRQNPTVFVYGVVNGIEGLFRSDDATSLTGNAAKAKWIKVASRLGNVTYLEGDRLTFAKVYVGTSGRGIFYGQPAKKTEISDRKP